MKHILGTVTFLFLFIQSFTVYAASPAAIKAMIQQFEAGKLEVGVHAYSLSQKREIFSYKADQKMNPASNAKVLSSATAFNKLGADFRFETQFLSQDPIRGGRVQDLFVVGGGDPQLTEDKIDLIADGLRSTGLKVIEGDIVIDQSFFDKRGFGDSMGNSDTFTTQLNALVINFNRFGVIVSPKSPKPTVKIDFPSDYFVLKNELRLGKGIVAVTKKFEKNREIVTVKGAYRGKKDYLVYRDVSQPTLFAGYFIKAFLEKRGIKVLGKVREGHAPENANKIYTHESDTLKDIVKVMNKRSINFTAEMVTKYLGAHFNGAPGSTYKGAQVIGQYLNSLGIENSQFTIENGSGLSRVTRITPKILTQVFKDVKSHSSYSTDYLNTLAVAGEDGTVRKRFRNSVLKGRAYLKTGTLTGVSSLAGYVEIPGGDDLTFSILISGAGLNAWKAHEFQENLLDLLIQ